MGRISHVALIEVDYPCASQMSQLWQVHEWRFLTVLIRFCLAFQKVDCASSVHLISTHLSIENRNLDLDRPDYLASVRLPVCDDQHFLQR